MAINSRRGQHPDIDPQTGDIKWQAYRYSDPRERAFQEMWDDPARRQRFMAEVAARQYEEDPVVQGIIQGRTYAPGDTPYAGYMQYEESRRIAREQAALHYGGNTIVHGDDVAKMSLQEYDRYFDERGRPRPGVVYRATSRDVPYDESTNSASRREFRNR